MPNRTSSPRGSIRRVSDEPADVLNYARSHPAFPHESTSNQFFTEAQFESYRMLGLHTIEQAVASPPFVAAWKARTVPVPAEC